MPHLKRHACHWACPTWTRLTRALPRKEYGQWSLALHGDFGPGPHSTDAPRARGDEAQANGIRCRVSLSVVAHLLSDRRRGDIGTTSPVGSWWGRRSTVSAQRGIHQFASPRSFISDGTSRARMTVASKMIPAARPIASGRSSSRLGFRWPLSRRESVLLEIPCRRRQPSQRDSSPQTEPPQAGADLSQDARNRPLVLHHSPTLVAVPGNSNGSCGRERARAPSSPWNPRPMT